MAAPFGEPYDAWRVDPLSSSSGSSPSLAANPPLDQDASTATASSFLLGGEGVQAHSLALQPGSHPNLGIGPGGDTGVITPAELASAAAKDLKTESRSTVQAQSANPQTISSVGNSAPRPPSLQQDSQPSFDGWNIPPGWAEYDAGTAFAHAIRMTIPITDKTSIVANTGQAQARQGEQESLIQPGPVKKQTGGLAEQATASVVTAGGAVQANLTGQSATQVEPITPAINAPVTIADADKPGSPIDLNSLIQSQSQITNLPQPQNPSPPQTVHPFVPSVLAPAPQGSQQNYHPAFQPNPTTYLHPIRQYLPPPQPPPSFQPINSAYPPSAFILPTPTPHQHASMATVAYPSNPTQISQQSMAGHYHQDAYPPYGNATAGSSRGYGTYERQGWEPASMSTQLSRERSSMNGRGGAASGSGMISHTPEVFVHQPKREFPDVRADGGSYGRQGESSGQQGQYHRAPSPNRPNPLSRNSSPFPPQTQHMQQSSYSVSPSSRNQTPHIPYAPNPVPRQRSFGQGEDSSSSREDSTPEYHRHTVPMHGSAPQIARGNGHPVVGSQGRPSYIPPPGQTFQAGYHATPAYQAEHNSQASSSKPPAQHGAPERRLSIDAKKNPMIHIAPAASHRQAGETIAAPRQGTMGKVEAGEAEDVIGVISVGPIGVDGWQLRVVQQPERARLCSFKEENETIDRRPVDPPPVVQLCNSRLSADAMVAASIQVRVVVVEERASTDAPLIGSHPRDYQEKTLAHGAVATTGETTHHPEKLQDLLGQFGAYCIFGKLSIRVPGAYRLRFEVIELLPTAQIRELASCVSEVFEVFSPKQFKGMKESTALIRHFASQGYKIKLRQAAGQPRGGTKRKATDPDTQRRVATKSSEAAIPGHGDHRTTISRPAPDPRLFQTGQPILNGSASSHHDPLRQQHFQIPPASSSPITATFPRQVSPSSTQMSGSTLTHPGGGSTAETSRSTRLPSISKASQEASVWLKNAGLLDDTSPRTDNKNSGTVMFRNGIRHGGDDGSLPPMTFGKLPDMLGEGILPTTPGVYNGASDLSFFSLKRQSINLGQSFHSGTGSQATSPSHLLTEFFLNGSDGAHSKPNGHHTEGAGLKHNHHNLSIKIPTTHTSQEDIESFSSALSNSLSGSAFNLAIGNRKISDREEHRRGSGD